MKTLKELQSEVNAEFATQVARTEMRAAKKEFALMGIALIAIGVLSLLMLSFL